MKRDSLFEQDLTEEPRLYDFNNNHSRFTLNNNSLRPRAPLPVPHFPVKSFSDPPAPPPGPVLWSANTQRQMLGIKQSKSHTLPPVQQQESPPEELGSPWRSHSLKTRPPLKLEEVVSMKPEQIAELKPAQVKEIEKVKAASVLTLKQMAALRPVLKKWKVRHRANIISAMKKAGSESKYPTPSQVKEHNGGRRMKQR